MGWLVGLSRVGPGRAGPGRAGPGRAGVRKPGARAATAGSPVAVVVAVAYVDAAVASHRKDAGHHLQAAHVLSVGRVDPSDGDEGAGQEGCPVLLAPGMRG